MKRAAVRVLLLLIAAECTLQAIDWLRWRHQLVDLDAPPVPGRALCVGDDALFDVGVASREDSWPVRAGRDIADVRNHALPRQDSAELLMDLPVWIDAVRPAVVYVGIGDADFARRSARPVLAGEIPGRALPHRFEFQLGRIVSGWFASAAETPSDGASLVGEWHHGEVAFDFRPDGVLDMSGQLAAWRIDGKALCVSVAGAPEVRMRWVLDGDHLQLEAPLQMTLERGAPERSPGDRVRRDMATGDWLEARWTTAVATAASDPDTESLAAAVELAMAEGRDADANAVLTRLRAHVAARGDAAARRALVDALFAMGDVDEGFDSARTGFGQHLEDPEFVRRVGQHVAGGAHADEFVRILDGLLADPSLPAPARAAAAFAAADAVTPSHADRALEFARRGIELLGPDAVPDAVTWPAVLRRADVADDPSWTDAQRVSVDRVRARLRAADDETAATLEHDLRLAVAVIRNFGARAVLLDLPGEPRARDARRAVAAALHVPILTGDRTAVADALAEDLRAHRAPR